MLFLDYGYHAWSMGYQDQSKRQLLPQIFAQEITLSSWCQVVLSAGIEYILLDPQNTAVEDGRLNVSNSMIARALPPQYTSPDGWRLYATAPICLNI